MYEDYYGFAEKPFSLTPDPKYLFRSETHSSAFDLLQYAIRRREGFVVVTGDIGTGKTTLCRAILEQLDRKTFTALVLDPFLSAEDLLRQILVDFGVVSRGEVRRGRLAGVSKRDLIETLGEFLLSLQPLGARAIVILDEAQNLSPEMLEQIRILSNLETDKEKLLQIVLVGQLNLHTTLRAPGMRQLDQRVSIRYELKPLSRDEAAAYVAHRLLVAGSGVDITFTSGALDLLHRASRGTPRLINLLCDRALLAGFAARTNQITADMVRHAADTLHLSVGRLAIPERFGRRAGLAAAAAAVVAAVGLSALLNTASGFGGWDGGTPPPARVADLTHVEQALETPAPSFSILVGSFASEADAAARATELERLGFSPYRTTVDSGNGSRWLQVLVGRYDDPLRAKADEAKLRRMAFGAARVVLD